MSALTTHPLRSGRTTELLLVVVAVGISVLAYGMVTVTTDATWSPGLGRQTALLGALGLGAHLVVRWRASYADPLILPVALLLNGLGLAVIHGIDAARATAGSTSAAFGPKQQVWTVLGVVLAAAVVIALRDHRILRRYTFTAMVAGLALLLLPLVPGLGVTINGASIWIRVGPLSFQPGELTKIVLAVFFAGYLVTARDTLSLVGPKVLGIRFPRPRDLGPILLAWAASVLVLVGQRDLGTSLLFFGLFVAMLYVATERISWIAIGLTLFVGGAVIAATTISHVTGRVDAWLHPFDQAIYDRDFGGSYQLVQGLFGFASGGLTGQGIGGGRPTIVPFAESDFVLATVGEQLGLVGVMAVLVLYLVLVQRALRTAIGVRDGFGKLLASGLGFTVALQCFVVAGGVLRVIPLTGLTLPFLAYGGSSLLANWIIVALLLRMSDAARRPAPAPVAVPTAGDQRADPMTARDEVSANETQVVRL